MGENDEDEVGALQEKFSEMVDVREIDGYIMLYCFCLLNRYFRSRYMPIQRKNTITRSVFVTDYDK